MNLGKQRRYHLKKYSIVCVVIGMVFFQSAEASCLDGSFIAEDGVNISTKTSLMENVVKGTVEQGDYKQGSAGRTTVQNSIKNLEMYDELTAEEKNILYKVVSMECDTDYEGSLAVISCMMNRMESDKYPDGLMDVVTEDSQFTAYYDKETESYPYVNREPSEECIAAVEDALYKGKRNIPSYILYFRSSEYSYLSGYKKYGQIGDNTYFYLDEDLGY